MNRSFHILIGILLIISACSEPIDKSILGDWEIIKIDYKVDSQNTGLKDVIVNSIASESMKPKSITVLPHQLILITETDEQAELEYEIIKTTSNQVHLYTPKGKASFYFSSADDISLSINQAKYFLKRRRP